MGAEGCDVAIVGGGHNGLVSAVLLARAGLRVRVLERRAVLGGAATSREVFPGTGARLSEYAYLLSMFPDALAKDLGIRVEARERRIASYTPRLARARCKGLLVSNASAQATSESFARFVGNDREHAGFLEFYERTAEVARLVAPTLLSPLGSRASMRKAHRDAGAADAWAMLFERPIEEAIESRMRDDTVRGVVYTDATIGIAPEPAGTDLLQNRCLLYHVVGNGVGSWKVPVGGMGKVTSELSRQAARHGAELMVGATVLRIDAGRPHTVVYSDAQGRTRSLEAKFVLSGVAPPTLMRLLGARRGGRIDDGSVFKINMLLDDLPQPKGDVDAKDAFAGTFHIDEGYRAIATANRLARRGGLSRRPPAEVYCHTLTDRSILPSGSKRQTLTLFGLAAPRAAFNADNNSPLRQRVTKRYLAGLNRYLETPIERSLATDEDGQPCIEAKTPLDIETELGMPRGNIFHGALTWPFATRRADVGSWGVATAVPRIYLCGSGAKRGGCVSGIPGHNAAMQVLQDLGHAEA